MERKVTFWICVISLTLGLLLVPPAVRAQEPKSEGPQLGSHVGSVFLSLFYIPIRLVTCVGTQFVTAPTYLITGDVPGNFEGGRDGRQIAEVSKGACTSSWVITPSQLSKDYE